MNINNMPKVVNEIANMANWTTTFVRTYCFLKPHLIERKVQALSAHRKVDAVYVTSEIDNPDMNHLHLAIAGRKLTGRGCRNNGT